MGQAKYLVNYLLRQQNPPMILKPNRYFGPKIPMIIINPLRTANRPHCPIWIKFSQEPLIIHRN
uniref:Uncharacterized protein n=1 Tax=Megaselia scalaris TaxID=36166 RepID=T1GHS1_MEGSC